MCVCFPAPSALGCGHVQKTLTKKSQFTPACQWSSSIPPATSTSNSTTCTQSYTAAVQQRSVVDALWHVLCTARFLSHSCHVGTPSATWPLCYRPSLPRLESVLGFAVYSCGTACTHHQNVSTPSAGAANVAQQAEKREQTLICRLLSW